MTVTEKSKLTPVMQQYVDMKSENPDALLMFRLGDFYESFFEDAKIISEKLGLVLTSRGSDGDGENISAPIFKKYKNVCLMYGGSSRDRDLKLIRVM